MVMTQRIAVLGATGSIGDSTLAILAAQPQLYTVYALSGYHRLDKLFALCQQFLPKRVSVPTAAVDDFAQRLRAAGLDIDVVGGEAGLVDIATDSQTDTVVAAIVGAAGLPSTLAAARAGKRILLANKEALVMAGQVMITAVKMHNATLLPLDSEHNAIFQCLPEGYFQNERNGQPKQGVSRILLTASGGPFLNHSLQQLKTVTVAQACKHPKWSMGQKISVDSATLMNKGLELIEACHLFAISEQFITVVVHPQSIIHSMVQYVDGSTLAQMGNPDMCTPIAHALAWPKRIKTHVPALDLFVTQQLDFQEPDTTRFPALKLARQAMQSGGLAPTILNAANEIAVAAFLNNRIGFTEISQVVEHTLNQVETGAAESIELILQVDQLARSTAEKIVMNHGS